MSTGPFIGWIVRTISFLINLFVKCFNWLLEVLDWLTSETVLCLPRSTFWMFACITLILLLLELLNYRGQVKNGDLTEIEDNFVMEDLFFGAIGKLAIVLGALGVIFIFMSDRPTLTVQEAQRVLYSSAASLQEETVHGEFDRIKWFFIGLFKKYAIHMLVYGTAMLVLKQFLNKFTKMLWISKKARDTSGGRWYLIQNMIVALGPMVFTLLLSNVTSGILTGVWDTGAYLRQYHSLFDVSSQDVVFFQITSIQWAMFIGALIGFAVWRRISLIPRGRKSKIRTALRTSPLVLVLIALITVGLYAFFSFNSYWFIRLIKFLLIMFFLSPFSIFFAAGNGEKDTWEDSVDKQYRLRKENDLWAAQGELSTMSDYDLKRLSSTLWCFSDPLLVSDVKNEIENRIKLRN